MRGKVYRRNEAAPGRGITPAYAGKSTSEMRNPVAIQDHPRVCGEKELELSVSVHTTGSPPRMRGKASSILVCQSCRRITPAYAGKSKFLCFEVFAKLDHPRVCGEKSSGG